MTSPPQVIFFAASSTLAPQSIFAVAPIYRDGLLTGNPLPELRGMLHSFYLVNHSLNQPNQPLNQLKQKTSPNLLKIKNKLRTFAVPKTVRQLADRRAKKK